MSGRYVRHEPLLGDDGRRRIESAHIVVAGVGGLGSHVTSLVVRLGGVSLELWDPGVLDEPDLNRQVLYTDVDLGRQKAPLARARLQAANPDARVAAHAEAINAARFRETRAAAGQWAPGDRPRATRIIFDCLDSFQARAGLDEIAQEWGAWIFHGGVEGWYGQATTIRPGSGGYAARFGADYHERAAAGKPIVPSVVAVVAAMQVGEFTRWAAHGAAALDGRFAVYDGHRQLVEHIELALEDHAT